MRAGNKLSKVAVSAAAALCDAGQAEREVHRFLTPLSRKERWRTFRVPSSCKGSKVGRPRMSSLLMLTSPF